MVLFKGRRAYASAFLLDTRALIHAYNERQPPRSKHRALGKPEPCSEVPLAHELGHLAVCSKVAHVATSLEVTKLHLMERGLKNK